MELYQTGDMQNPRTLATQATRKRLDFRCATRNPRPQVPCTEPAWALQKAKAIGQICKKPRENQGFAAERTGFEPAVGCYPYADLANRCFRPLSHLSGSWVGILPHSQRVAMPLCSVFQPFEDLRQAFPWVCIAKINWAADSGVPLGYSEHVEAGKVRGTTDY